MARAFLNLGWLLGGAAVLCGVGAVVWHRPQAGPVGPRPRLVGVGPKLVSNQTSQPLSVYGEGLVPGLELVLGPPLSRKLPLVVEDERHAYARLPAGLTLPASEVQAYVSVRLGAAPSGPPPEGEAALTLVNDTGFDDLGALALAPDGRTLFIASQPTDTVYALEVDSGRVQALAAGDGPSALAAYRDSAGRPWLAVAHRYAPQLRLYPLEQPGSPPRVLPAPAGALGLVVDAARQVAWVSEHVGDKVHALSLEEGREQWAASVDPNSRALARWRGWLVAGSLQTGQLVLLREDSGAPGPVLVPQPGMPVTGGGTERYSAQVMGGKAVRGLVASERLGRLFMASLGPNVGPNADRMEVSANGGVAVVDVEGGRVERHLGFGAGVTEGLALDEERGLLYAADAGLGRVRVLEARRLAAGDRQARQALLQELPVAPPEGTPLVRPAEDFGVQGRAGVELHSGPRALALSGDGRTLYVLNRLTGTVAVVDVAEAPAGKARLVRQWQVLPPRVLRAQARRRLGQVLYYADLGRSAMSCDACHLEGHTGGVFFEKTRPLRIYRSTTALGSRDTPPYFTPASTHSLAETMIEVGSRNRFFNPPLSDSEVDALALFVSLLPTPPNPYRGPEGAPPRELALPGGALGHPGAGRALFSGKAGCVQCHPPPLYTLDQDAATRGRYLEVGTPPVLPLRPEQQDKLPGGFGTPSLVGAWDVWPMLGTGSAGFSVQGERLVVSERFALRAVLELSGPGHGHVQGLTPQERNDLLAFLLTL